MIFRCLWTLNISVGEIDILPHREILTTVLAILEVFRYAHCSSVESHYNVSLLFTDVLCGTSSD